MPQRYRNTTRLNELLSTSQNKSYFVGAVTVIFIVVMSMVGIVPAYSAFTFQHEENGKRDVLIEKLTKKLTISQALSREYDEKEAVVEYFAESFPDNADQEGIITLLNDIVNVNNSYIVKMTFNKNPTPSFTQLAYEEQIKSQQVSVTAEGSQSALLSIVKDVENSRRILNIAAVTLDRKPQDVINAGTPNGEYVLNLQMEYYFYTNTESL